MLEVGVEDGPRTEPTEKMIRAQLELLVEDEVFRSSRRSVAFLRYVVQQTLNGSAESIKERTIGVEVFGRQPSYDTNLDHIVRTAATELRKRLAIYYGDERRRTELRMSLVPGSYIPRFTLPPHASVEPGTANETADVPHYGHVLHAASATEIFPEKAILSPAPASRKTLRRWGYMLAAIVFGVCGVLGYSWLNRPGPQALFWKPILDSPGPVLLAVGDVPNGPPTSLATGDNGDNATPIVRSNSSLTVPFADAVTIARVVGVLESKGKKVVIRREHSRTFSDLREGPVVLIGAFNNEWSLRLTSQLRFSLALDAARHLIYIRDAKNPSSREWSWKTNQSPDQIGGAGGPVLRDYALISRIRNSETGHVVVVIGGLYTYGTQSAGEFLTDPQLMHAVATAEQMDSSHSNLQIVLGTSVTDDAPGPPRVLAVATD
jgi:hypothetical protein